MIRVETQVLKAIQYLVFANCNCERARGGGKGLCKGCFALSDKLTVSLNTFQITDPMKSRKPSKIHVVRLSYMGRK